MPTIDADTIRKLITSEGELFVPEVITEAIGHTTANTVEDISNEIKRLSTLYKQYVTIDEPTPVSYSDETTIDAYSINYLPRNTLIPKLLFISLAYHPAFQQIKDEVNILDLGSGTGGVVLGLLDLFKDKPFSEIKPNIMSCERSPVALTRQKELLKHTKYQNCNVWHSCSDVTDIKTYENYLFKLAPYDYIIAANLFAELSPDDIKLVLTQLPSIMAPNAVLLIADPPRRYVDKLKKQVLDTLRDLGLYCYYPCPQEYKCTRTKCQWVWLSFNFDCPDIDINGDTIETTKLFKTTWSIYCRSKYSIYDVLQKIDADLTWGVCYPFGNEFNPKEKMDYSICTPNGPYKVEHTRKKTLFRDREEVILRGSVLGYNDDYSKVIDWHPLYGLKLD